MYFFLHLSEYQYFSSRKIDENVVFLATTHDKSGLTRRELPCVVTRNETLSGYRNCITVYAGLTGWRRGCEGCKGELLSCFLNDNLMQFLHNKILKLRINIDLFLRLWHRIWGVGQLNRAIKRSTRTAWKYEPVPPCNVLIKKFWITILFNDT